MIYGIGAGELINSLVLLANTILVIYATTQIRKVEIATNSMKDALVKVTGESEHAKGVIAGRNEAISENKT